MQKELSGSEMLPELSRNGPLAPVVQTLDSAIHQAPVVQKLDNAIQRISRYPEDKYCENKLLYPLDSNLSSGLYYPSFEQLGPDKSLSSK